MRFIVRWIFRLAILAIVIGVAAVLLKDTALRSLAERWLRQETGLEVRIGRIETGLFNSWMTIQDLRVYNPPELGGGALVLFPELHLEWDPQALARKNLHLRLARIHMSELTVVRDAKGHSSLDLLKSRMPALTNLAANMPARNGPSFTGIDVLNLTIERLRVVDLKNPGKPFETDVGLKNEIIRNARSLEDVTVPLTKRLLEKSLSGLLNLSPPAPPKPERSTKPAK